MNMKKTFLLSILSVFALAACSGGSDYANGGPDAPLYNERTATFMMADNDYANIDSYKPKDGAEMEETHDKWNTSRMETHWQEYKGTILLICHEPEFYEGWVDKVWNIEDWTTKII